MFNMQMKADVILSSHDVCSDLCCACISCSFDMGRVIRPWVYGQMVPPTPSPSQPSVTSTQPHLFLLGQKGKWAAAYLLHTPLALDPVKLRSHFMLPVWYLIPKHHGISSLCLKMQNVSHPFLPSSSLPFLSLPLFPFFLSLPHFSPYSGSFPSLVFFFFFGLPLNSLLTDNNLELLIFLFPPLTHWDHRHTPPSLITFSSFAQPTFFAT